MALSRALLKGMNLTDEQVQAIIDAHRETVDGLKAEVDKYKADAEALPGVQKELDDLKKDGGDWQKKYDDEHKAFEDYKKDIEDKQTRAGLETAYKKLLTEQKVGEKHIESILRVTDFSQMKLKKDGTLEDADKLAESIKKDWGGFIPTTETKGAGVETPPAGGGKGSHGPSRAAELEKQYHDNLYGTISEKKE